MIEGSVVKMVWQFNLLIWCEPVSFRRRINMGKTPVACSVPFSKTLPHVLISWKVTGQCYSGLGASRPDKLAPTAVSWFILLLWASSLLHTPRRPESHTAVGTSVTQPLQRAAHTLCPGLCPFRLESASGWVLIPLSQLPQAENRFSLSVVADVKMTFSWAGRILCDCIICWAPKDNSVALIHYKNRGFF